MSIFEIIGGIIILVCALVIVVTVMSQEGKSGSMNALSGSNESSYLGKNKNRSNQAMLLRLTKYTSILFVLTTLVVYMISSAMAK